MVEINFGRRRPAGLLDLTRIGEIAAWSVEDGVLRIGAGVTYAQVESDLGRAGARAGDGLAHGRLAADPQPGHGRRQPRLRVPGRRRAPAAAGRGGHRRGGVGARQAARRGGRLLHRREAQRARARRADPGRARPGHRRAAAVRQDRHPQRDGDRGGLVRPRAASRRAPGRHRHRVGRSHAPQRTGGRGSILPASSTGTAGRRSTRPSYAGSGSSSPRPPTRSTTSAAARRTAGTRWPCWPAAPLTWAWDEYRTQEAS